MVDKIVVEVTCKRGHSLVLVNPSLSTRGGCSGHPEDQYCYCDSLHVEVGFECAECIKLDPYDRWQETRLWT